MKKIPLFGVALALLMASPEVSTLCGAEGDDSKKGVSFPIEWQVGKRYHQRITIDQEAAIEVPQFPQPVQQDMTQQQEYSIEVRGEQPGGGHELVLEFLSQKIEMKMGGNTVMSVDSENLGEAQENPAAKAISQLMGTQVTYYTDASGNITRVEGLDELAKKIGGASSGPAQQMIAGMLNEDVLKQWLDMRQGLPEEPVSIGDSWPVKTEIPLGPLGRMNVEMNYTFQEWAEHDGRRTAVLAHEGTLTTQTTETNSGQSAQIQDGTTEGTTWYAPEIGMVVDSVTHQKMTLLIQAQGQEITNRMTQEVRNQLIKIEDVSK